MKETVLTVRELTKRYGQVLALDRLSLEVKKGEIFGILGTNGAGKTTAIEIFAGVRQPDSGEVRLWGELPYSMERSMRARVGLMPERASFHRRMKVGEALRQAASYYKNSLDIEKLMREFNLLEARERFIDNLSRGQRQVLLAALALIYDPEIIFLDEPTTGLDPHSRHAFWRLIKQKRLEGKTIVFTTQYIGEAQWLCDRVAILDSGRMVALGTTRELIARGQRIKRVELRSLIPLEPALLESIAGVRRVERYGDSYILFSEDSTRTVEELMKRFEGAELTFEDLRVFNYSLEDVFVELTGHKLRLEAKRTI